MSKVSIIMGIYNCAETLGDAINCILHQTYTDWELILCDDGSTDNTYSVARSFYKTFPDKIILLRNESNQGLNITLNRCLSLASGQIIARMDGDDLCPPDRFEQEIRVLEQERDIAFVSGAMECFDENGVWGCVRHKEYPEREDFLYNSPFCHAPCMVRRDAYMAVGGYTEDKRLLRVEDYHLWIKMYKAGYKGKNIQNVLYQMRDDRNANNRRKFKYRLNEAYVRILAVRELGLPRIGYIRALRPIILGLMPITLYDKIHKYKLRRKALI